MAEKKELYEKAKEEMRLSERILAEIPLRFRGYKEKELRREADSLIMNHIYEKMLEAREDFGLSELKKFWSVSDILVLRKVK